VLTRPSARIALKARKVEELKEPIDARSEMATVSKIKVTHSMKLASRKYGNFPSGSGRSSPRV
jgi:hypothetical protein